MRLTSLIVLLAALPLGCASRPAPRPTEAGASTTRIRIDSRPTPAWIFVDGHYVGRTPVEPAVEFTHATHFIDVVAVPTHTSQTRQALRLVPPGLPHAVTFFLDNQDPRAVKR
jgi:hypothetical protein